MTMPTPKRFYLHLSAFLLIILADSALGRELEGLFPTIDIPILSHFTHSARICAANGGTPRSISSGQVCTLPRDKVNSYQAQVGELDRAAELDWACQECLAGQCEQCNLCVRYSSSLYSQDTIRSQLQQCEKITNRHEGQGKGVPGGGTSGPTQAAQTETEPTEAAEARRQPSQTAGTDQEPAEPAQQPGQPTSGEQQQQQGGLSPQEQADLKDAVEACERAHKEATEACNQPFKKAFGVDLGPDDMQMIMTVLNVGGQTALASRAGSQKSMAKACGMMRDVGYATTALNAGFATQCQSFRSSCLTQCQHLESIMRQVVARCENDPACSVSQQVSLNNTSQRVAACQQYSGQVAGMATQALMALYSAEGASMCRDLAKVQDFGLPPPKTSPPANRPNCADPANASNPVCLECRSPESRNNPMCRDVNAQIPGGDGRSNQSSRTPPGGNDGEDFDLSNLGLEDDPNQMAQMPITEPGEASARRPSGSGTGLGGGGGPQGYDGAPGGHGDPGIDTDILHGVGGGGGYTTSSVPFSSGGGGGGFGLPPRPDSAGEKFDLRKFLPGRQGVKGLQKVTGGEGRRHPELAPSHDNIWRRVSNKYQQLCQRGELYGCQ